MTVYVPKLLVATGGAMKYYGNFPVTKEVAPEKSESINDGLSVRSGSPIGGSFNRKDDPTSIFKLVVKGVVKNGGPLFGAIVTL